MSEFKLEANGTISGPEKSSDGRYLITHSIFVEDSLPEGELINTFNNYYILALQAILKRTQQTAFPSYAWNVHVQSVPFIYQSQIGTLYCTFAEIDE